VCNFYTVKRVSGDPKEWKGDRTRKGFFGDRGICTNQQRGGQKYDKVPYHLRPNLKRARLEATERHTKFCQKLASSSKQESIKNACAKYAEKGGGELVPGVNHRKKGRFNLKLLTGENASSSALTQQGG